MWRVGRVPSGPDGRPYLPSGGTVTVLVDVKQHLRGEHTYFVDVHCA
jgi:hypothetical protein